MALVGVGAWQIWGAVHGGEALRAENMTITPLAEQARTPFSGLDWQSEFVSEAGVAPAAADLPPKPRAGGGSGVAKDKDGLSNIAGNVTGVLLESYATLAESGEYTSDAGERIAGDVAESLRARVSYKTYGANDVTTTSDTSYDRMLTYRGDMQVALGPLLKNTEYELNIFARYIESGDADNLAQLQRTAENYRAATEQAAKLTVPRRRAPASRRDIERALRIRGDTRRIDGACRRPIRLGRIVAHVQQCRTKCIPVFRRARAIRAE